MTKLSLLDNAIKSFVEIPKNIHGRIIYSRAQLLGYRYCRTAQDWPPVFDRRFAKSKIKRWPHLCAGFNKNTELSFTNSRAPLEPQEKALTDSKSDSQRPDRKEHRFYDEAIVSAKSNFRNTRESFYDPPVLSCPQKFGRLNYSDCVEQQPEWYLFGPEDAEEEVEHYDYDMAAGDEEKENNVTRQRIFRCYKAGSEYFDQKSEILGEDGDQDKSLSSSKTNEYPLKNDHPPNIKTLREIESKLRVKRNQQNASSDMSAYYKLLGLVGTSLRNSSENMIGPTVVTHKSTNNNQPRIVKSEGVKFSAALNQLKADPAISEVIDSNPLEEVDIDPKLNEFDAVRSKLNTVDLMSIDSIDAAARVSCNPITASYQRHVMASGPLGQNALRWFKAMTNAASASACISQNLDGTIQNTSSEKMSESIQVINETSLQRDFPVERSTQQQYTSKIISSNADNDSFNPNLGSFHMRPVDHMLNSALSLGLGVNLPIRPMKPSLFYYPAHSNQLFGRPIINPLLLQQLLQYQLSLRTLQTPFNYLRMQPLLPPLGYNLYTSAINNIIESKIPEIADNPCLSKPPHDINPMAANIQIAQQQE